MKILVLAPQPFFQNRGTPIAVRLLAEILGKAGHEVHLLVFHEGEDVALDNVTLHRIPALPWLGPVRPGFSAGKLVCDLLMAAACVRLLRRVRFDFVHAVEEAAFIAMVLEPFFRVPYVYDLDSWMSDQLLAKLAFLRPLRGLFERCELLAVRRCAGAVPVCRAIEEKIGSAMAGRPMVRLEDISLLEEGGGGQPESLRERTGCQGALLLYVGNLERYQGMALFLEALALADPESLDCNLAVVGGTAEDIGRHEALARTLGIGGRVCFVGPRPATDLGMYLAQADVLVSPRTEGENTPMKIYSYMDSGRPILATRIASHTQALDDSMAFLAEPTPASMAAGLKSLLADREEAGRRAARARARARAEHSRPAYERKLLGFYDQLAKTADRDHRHEAKS